LTVTLPERNPITIVMGMTPVTTDEKIVLCFIENYNSNGLE